MQVNFHDALIHALYAYRAMTAMRDTVEHILSDAEFHAVDQIIQSVPRWDEQADLYRKVAYMIEGGANVQEVVECLI